MVIPRARVKCVSFFFSEFLICSPPIREDGGICRDSSVKEQWSIYKRGQVGGRNSVSIPQVGGLNPSLGTIPAQGMSA